MSLYRTRDAITAVADAACRRENGISPRSTITTAVDRERIVRRLTAAAADERLGNAQLIRECGSAARG
jgi:hypothetical protein